MSFICPNCQKQLKTKKSLKKHLENIHGEKPGATLSGPEENPPNPQILEIKTPETKTNEGHYHCVDCGATLTKGQTPCPNCGVGLDWSE